LVPLGIRNLTLRVTRFLCCYVELARTSIERSAVARGARDDTSYTKGYFDAKAWADKQIAANLRPGDAPLPHREGPRPGRERRVHITCVAVAVYNVAKVWVIALNLANAAGIKEQHGIRYDPKHFLGRVLL
jgi:hypothetical protein